MLSNGGDTAGSFGPLQDGDPRLVGGYRLVARLGSGGMGRVYLSHTPGGRAVAVKVIRPELAENAEFRTRFRAEVTAASRVHGLYTAPVVDSDTEGPVPWCATAYVPGPSLADAVRDHGPLPVDTVLRLVAGVAEALQAVHRAGVVHRDLKPSNVLLAADGPRVIDFGIARATDTTSVTQSGMALGTVAYMAPEQVLGGEATSAADVFALGQTAVFAATGSAGFGGGDSHAVLYRVIHEEPDLGRVPPELRELIAGCLRKPAGERPAPAEVIRAVQAIQARRGDEARFASGAWLPGVLAAGAAAMAASADQARGTGATATGASGSGAFGAAVGYAPAGPGVAAGAGTGYAPTGPGAAGAPGQYAGAPWQQPQQAAQAQQPQSQQWPSQEWPSQQPSQQAQEHQPHAYSPPAPQPYRQQPPGSQQPVPGHDGPHSARTAPVDAGGGRRRRAPVWLLSAAAVVLVACGAGAAVLFMPNDRDRVDDRAQELASTRTAERPRESPSVSLEASARTSKKPERGRSAQPPPPSGAPSASREATSAPPAAASREPAAPKGPTAVSYPGLRMTRSQDLYLADTPVRPEADTGSADEDLTYAVYSSGAVLAPGTDSGSSLALLPAGRAGSLQACRAATGFKSYLWVAELTPGRQMCVISGTGHVGLVTFRGASGTPSATLDVKVWRGGA
ncbi:serine/threonine-protein kinase [Streptomyces sp. NPDC091377]|uniref:serine/threonine-protein kinase n=1 Tax=Streptomyces sp. NPDC091377 TaxID=3365995 RepID=UPI003821FF8A